MTRVGLAVGAAALGALLLGGCGTTSSGSGDGGSTPSPATSLTVAVRTSAQAAPTTWTLTCDPPGGSHPDPTGACAALARVEHPFDPVPPGRACSQIYGGPQTATVTGRYLGQEVDAAFSRTDGCQIARWQAVSALLVVDGGLGPVQASP